MPIIPVGIVDTITSITNLRYELFIICLYSLPLLNILVKNIPILAKISITICIPSATSFAISLWNAIKIATRVPKCSIMSKNIPPLPKSTPSICLIIIRCPELLTGRNSASPCTRPSITAFHTGIGNTPYYFYFTILR